MITINYLKEEEKIVQKTYKEFARECLKISLLDTTWMSDERIEQQKRLKDCLNDYENSVFIAESVIDNDEPDNFSKIAQVNLAFETLVDNDFITLLSGQSLTNRIITACEKKYVYPELQYRIKQCIWIYKILMGDVCEED